MTPLKGILQGMSSCFRAVLVVASLLATSGLPVAAQQPSWRLTGALNTARSGHTATLLANGKVLVVGGTEFLGNSPPYWRGIRSAEIYDPSSGAWSSTGNLNSARGQHLAVRLANGKVLVVGGDNGYTLGVTTAELYDPDTGTFSGAGSISVPRMSATATLLADGRVLVAGGAADQFSRHGSAELYDPATNSWRRTGQMTTVRSAHTATLLPSGKVLVVDGSTELYDPKTETWTATGNSIAWHVWDHQVALLPNGKVLVFGGGISGDDFCNGINDAELYDPETGRWSLTEHAIGTRNDYWGGFYTMVLPNGKVMVVGGLGPGCEGLNSADLYDPATGTWSVTASPKTVRSGHTVTQLADGKVLVTGGGMNSAELFDSGSPVLYSVSAANVVSGRALATESIASGFGADLAGVSVTVRDRVGIERLAPLFFDSPGQINYQIPQGTAVGGLATVTASRVGHILAAGLVEIAEVAPGLFSGAMQVTRIKADGTLQVDPLGEGVDFGPVADDVILSLYGTGIRFRSALSGVRATIGGVGSEVLYAGSSKGVAGLDQINLRVPRSLAGRGNVEVLLTVDGIAANPVRVNIR